MPTKSIYPDFQVPEIGLWDFLFERKDKTVDDGKAIFIDAHSNRKYNFTTLKQTASDFGKGLKGLWDWQKNDVLCLYTPNCIDTPAVTWGCHFAGGIVSPANPGYTVDELTFQLKNSGAKALATQAPQLDVALKACANAGIPHDRVILLGDGRDATAQFKHFTSIRNISGTQRYRRARVNPGTDLAFIVYSSGTTGLPKGVMLSHRNVVANTIQLITGEVGLSGKGLSSADSMLSFLPFFHIYGLTALLHLPMRLGLATYVMPRFELEDFCRLVTKHRITYSYVAPPVVLQLSKHPIVEKYDLSSLRMLSSGAAPLTRELVEAHYSRLHVPVKQAYGLSETSPSIFDQPFETWRDAIGSTGVLLPNILAKFMSSEDHELPAGEVGELWVKGPNVFQGYLNNPEGTANALTSDGYFKTGDVGFVDKHGNFYITDRVKELIKYKGFQVPPAELEGILVANEQVDDVCVIGIYNENEATEVPLAFVVPKEGVPTSPATAKGIADWLSTKVANHKKLRGGVIFTGEIPKSASGKILRRVLKAKYEEEVTKQKSKQTGGVKSKL